MQWIKANGEDQYCTGTSDDSGWWMFSVWSKQTKLYLLHLLRTNDYSLHQSATTKIGFLLAIWSWEKSKKSVIASFSLPNGSSLTPEL